MGREVRDMHESEESKAMAAIDSYCLSIDMTARNVQDEAKKKGLPWSIGKGFDTFLPLSDLVSKTAISDPYNVDLSLAVNGTMKQQDNTNLMMFRIPRIMSDISKVMTLEPGDLVLTGTPKGVGQVFAGDRMLAGMKVNGIDIAVIDVGVEDRTGLYEFTET